MYISSCLRPSRHRAVICDCRHCTGAEARSRKFSPEAVRLRIGFAVPSSIIARSSQLHVHCLFFTTESTSATSS